MVEIYVPSKKIHVVGRIAWQLETPSTHIAGAFVRKKGRTHNTITNDGDLFYAYRAALEQPPDDLFTTGAALAFDGIMELYADVTAAPSKSANRSSITGGSLVTGSAKAMDSGYPKRNDDDADNPDAAADAVTYRTSYTTSEANDTNIDDVCLTNPSPGASEKLLSWGDGLGITSKTSSDTLKVWVTHEFAGS